MNGWKWKTLSFWLIPILLLTSCGSSQGVIRDSERWNISKELEYESSMELQYATEFSVDYYTNGAALICTADDSRFLVLPEGEETPDDLDEDIVTLTAPLSDIYLAGTAVMDMFRAMDGIGAISLSSQEEDSWYIEAAREAMEDGQIEYAGKYSAPDYEKILSSGCRLAIESTMIEHTPEVKEELISLGVPVLVDYSSYEEHPLGRSEWVKLYGTLIGHEEEAKAAFDAQVAAMDSVAGDEPTGKTVAFFYITTNGAVNVRKTQDYVPKMIEIAGGTYIFPDLGDDSASTSMNMQMEEFYAEAKDADYLVYNSTIEGELNSLEDLLDLSGVLADFKAVQDGNVWCMGQNMYQDSMETGTVIQDFHTMLTVEDATDDDFTYLYKLE
ncbi:MAG: ABC transporter substrate-binding protein [Lachnospiraceae bacterium]|nr:ABC transporter substrate-binding protein [Lachnospiraceae bacterium]